ncbi:glycosyltransferase family A protein [Pacificoceanicola onchidii]|uniref:glycosyltransferase family A protein n=1 Tax=Pacificoceanicola onchidii TaxID=2562685 RepID=UPI0010A61D27|nr:glycosyltransferase family A protein [Pacificoceanicola onchidii]
MVKLSIILNTYAMQREAPRTLRSMLPPLQKEVCATDYEVIVIDNGSPQALSLAGVDFGGVPVCLHRIAPEQSHPSPVFAMNACAADQARGRFVMLCIDGARMFSPYLVRRTIDALERAPGACTYVASRHLGPEVQMRSVQKGYDQAAEDALLAGAGWEADLDRLNAVSVWAGAHRHGTVYTQNESNAFALERALWLEMGGYREGFARSGGGLCNLEAFNRAMERPGARNILLWGEATFHQVHGGVATSKEGFFRDSQEEFRQAAGYDYRFPRYDFEVDMGLAYGREEAVGEWYWR